MQVNQSIKFRALKLRIILTTLCLLALARPSLTLAETLYGITFDQQLITIDTTTGAGTLVGPLDSTMNGFGLAVQSGKLYTYDQVAYRIRQLDPDTGHTLATIDIGLDQDGEGDLAFRSDGIGFLANGAFFRFDITVPSSTIVNHGIGGFILDGLAFDGSDVLYGISSSGGNITISPKLYTIDAATGDCTLVGDTFLPGNNDTGGLAFAWDGTIYVALSYGSGSRLYTIDQASGAATLVGEIGFPEVSGITFLGPNLPRQITMTPAFATNDVNTSHTVCATVITNSVPAENLTVTFTVVAGPNIGTTGSAVTDINGVACFTYPDNGGIGLDFIQGSFIDSQGATNKSLRVRKQWVPNITLGPASAINLTNSSHTICALVTSNGLPAPNFTVVFTVISGPNSGVTGTSVTDTGGTACFTYTDGASVGTDQIIARFTNWFGIVQTSQVVFKNWVAPSPCVQIISHTNIEVMSCTNIEVPFTVTATSSCCSNAPTVVCTPSSPGPFAVGTTTVHCVATDCASNSASYDFKVTVTCVSLVRIGPDPNNYHNLFITWQTLTPYNWHLQNSTDLLHWTTSYDATNLIPPVVISNINNFALPAQYFRLFRTN
jgi:hypothetical protein